MDALTLDHAMELFKLPRTLGDTAEGETIITNVGRFGPYVKYGSKYVSLKEDDPYTITHERALEVIRLKKEADANRIITDFAADGIQVLNGRYGPYVTDGKKNAKIPKDREPKSLTLEECRALIAQAPERGGGRFGRGKRASTQGRKGNSKANNTVSPPGNHHAGAQAPDEARAPHASAKAAPKRSSKGHGNDSSAPLKEAIGRAGKARASAPPRARGVASAAAGAAAKASSHVAQGQVAARKSAAAGAQKSATKAGKQGAHGPAARKPPPAQKSAAARVRGSK